MSRAQLETFFPTLASQLRAVLPGIYDHLLPDDVAESCTEPSLVFFDRFAVRRPFLAIAASAGAIIGLRGAKLFAATKPAKGKRLVGGWNLAPWSLAFGAFGCMNVSALLYHCLLPVDAADMDYGGTTRGGSLRSFFWAMDCICTGNSSIMLGIGALGIWREVTARYFASAPKLKELDHCLVVGPQWAWALSALTGLAFLITGNENLESFLEWWYMLTTVSAGVVLFLPILLDALNAGGGRSTPIDRRSVVGARVAIMGGMILLVGVPLDSILCRNLVRNNLNSSVWAKDAAAATTLAFLGCNCSFYGLSVWICGRRKSMHKIC